MELMLVWLVAKMRRVLAMVNILWYQHGHGEKLQVMGAVAGSMAVRGGKGEDAVPAAPGLRGKACPEGVM